MSKFTLPEDWQTLAAGYVLGDLNSEEMVLYQQLLKDHPELSHAVVSLQETLSMLPYGLPQQQPNSQVRSRLLARAKAQLNSTNAPRPRVSAGKRRQISRVARIAASVAIILGGLNVWLSYRVITLQARLASAERFVEMAIASDFTAHDGVSVPALTVSPAGPLLTQQWSGLSQLVQDHLRSLRRSQGPVDVVESNPETLLTQFSFSEQKPMLVSPQAKLLGGSRCQFGDAQGLRLTYQLPAEQTVSLYQINLKGDQFPEFLETYITLKQQHVNLILWRQENYLYALAAALPLTDLQTLVQTVDSI